jgi:hypothetical protein
MQESGNGIVHSGAKLGNDYLRNARRVCDRHGLMHELRRESNELFATPPQKDATMFDRGIPVSAVSQEDPYWEGLPSLALRSLQCGRGPFLEYAICQALHEWSVGIDSTSSDIGFRQPNRRRDCDHPNSRLDVDRPLEPAGLGNRNSRRPLRPTKVM